MSWLTRNPYARLRVRIRKPMQSRSSCCRVAKWLARRRYEYQKLRESCTQRLHADRVVDSDIDFGDIDGRCASAVFGGRNRHRGQVMQGQYANDFECGGCVQNPV